MTEKPFKLSLEKLSLMRTGLMSLDTYEKVISENGRERVVRVPFELGVLRLTIAQNLSRLQPFIDDYTKAHNDIVGELSGGGDRVDPKDQANWNKYNAACREMNQTEHEVVLKLLPEASLKLETNPLPLLALGALMELIQ